MPTLDKDDLEMIINALNAREHDPANPEDSHKDGSPKIHTRTIRNRVTMVTIVIVSLSFADHFIHLEWMFRAGELVCASFFDWWFNVANRGEMKVKMPPLKLPRRKVKEDKDK
jgi:hypothetical protein